MYLFPCGYAGTEFKNTKACATRSEIMNFVMLFCMCIYLLQRHVPAHPEELRWNSEWFWCHYCNWQGLQQKHHRASSLTMRVYSVKSASSFLFASKTTWIIQQTRSLAPNYSPYTTWPMKYIQGGWLHSAFYISSSLMDSCYMRTCIYILGGM